MFRGQYFVYLKGNYFQPTGAAPLPPVVDDGPTGGGGLYTLDQQEIDWARHRKILIRDDDTVFTIITLFMETI